MHFVCFYYIWTGPWTGPLSTWHSGIITLSKNRVRWLLYLFQDLTVKWEKIWGVQRDCRYFNVSFLATTCSPIFHKTNVPLNDLKKIWNQQVWNKILNIKPYRGQISRTYEFLMCVYGRKSMVVGEKSWQKE
jgi:hypothetical protein